MADGDYDFDDYLDDIPDEEEEERAKPARNHKIGGKITRCPACDTTVQVRLRAAGRRHCISAFIFVNLVGDERVSLALGQRSFCSVF